MARFNEILVGRYNRFLQKLFQMKGGAPAPQLAGDIQVGLNLFHGVENRVLEGWDRYASAINLTPVAAQVSNWRIRNPAGSNVMAVIEKLAFGETAADTVAFRQFINNTDLATVDSPFRIDQRSRPNPTCVTSHGNNVAVINQTWRARLAAGQTLDLIWYDGQELTLLPGDSLDFATTAVNVQVDGACSWRERALEESERT